MADAKKVEPLALMASKAIARLHRSAAAKAVGVVLLDHLNWKSGQCDPSLQRLAMLTGYTRSNVQSGLKQLSEEKIIKVVVHGGRSGRNAYRFNWALIRAFDAEFQAALKTGRAPPRKQGVGGPENRAQTRSSNPMKEPGEVGVCARGQRPASRPDGQAEGSKPIDQLYLTHSIKGGQGASRKDAAEASRHRRRALEIAAMPKHLRAAAWEADIAAADATRRGAA